MPKSLVSQYQNNNSRLGNQSGALRMTDEPSLLGGQLSLGKHISGLLAGCTVDQVVAEEGLRGCCAGGAVLGDVVGAERPRFSDQSDLARWEESRSGAATSGVRRGALCPGGRNQSD